jgi:hypothetical protein
MFRAVTVLVLGALVCGCVSTKTVPVDVASTSSFQGKTITTSRRGVPDFSAMTAGKAMFGMVGVAAMISKGNAIVRENKVEDPADYISSRLIADLAQKHSLSPAENGGTLVADETPEKLATQYASSNYLLDVRTINWSFGYFPADWNSYRVIYSAKLRLIDTSNAKVMAESFCSRVPDKTDGAPSLDELTANQAQRLKDELRAAADYCIGEFKSNALSL